MNDERIHRMPQGESLLSFLGAMFLIMGIVGAVPMHTFFGPIAAFVCFVQGVFLFAILKGFASMIILLKFIAGQLDSSPAPSEPEGEYRPPQ